MVIKHQPCFKCGFSTGSGTAFFPPIPLKSETSQLVVLSLQTWQLIVAGMCLSSGKVTCDMRITFPLFFPIKIPHLSTSVQRHLHLRCPAVSFSSWLALGMVCVVFIILNVCVLFYVTFSLYLTCTNQYYCTMSFRGSYYLCQGVYMLTGGGWIRFL